MSLEDKFIKVKYDQVTLDANLQEPINCNDETDIPYR